LKQDTVLEILKQRQAELAEQFGVKSLSLFGSVARDEATSLSDVDLLVEFNRPVGYFGLFALHDYLEKLLGCSVDLGTPDSLKPYIRERILGISFMSPRDWRNCIWKILDSISGIQRFTAGMNYQTFKSDDKCVRAVEMNFIIIGEL
jgi:predicted nucleotidyltransferase